MNRRRETRLPIGLLVDQYAGDKHQVAMSIDLGPGGLCLCARPQKLRPVVAVAFTLPGQDEAIWAKGELRFANRGAYFPIVGLAFTGIAELHREMIFHWMTDHRLGEMRAAMRWPGAAARPCGRAPRSAPTGMAERMMVH